MPLNLTEFLPWGPFHRSQTLVQFLKYGAQFTLGTQNLDFSLFISLFKGVLTKMGCRTALACNLFSSFELLR